MLIDFVWEISTDNGDINYDQKAIRSVVVDHFKTLFSQMQGFNMENELKTIQNFPRYFENEDCLSIGKPISVTEVKNTLKLFAKDKSPCPDGWTLGFFLAFL